MKDEPNKGVTDVTGLPFVKDGEVVWLKPVAYPRTDLTAMVSEMFGMTPAPKETLTYKGLRDELLADPSTSYWLRSALASLEARDPVDALHDVQVLMELADLRVK